MGKKSKKGTSRSNQNRSGKGKGKAKTATKPTAAEANNGTSKSGSTPTEKPPIVDPAVISTQHVAVAGSSAPEITPIADPVPPENPITVDPMTSTTKSTESTDSDSPKAVVDPVTQPADATDSSPEEIPTAVDPVPPKEPIVVDPVLANATATSSDAEVVVDPAVLSDKELAQANTAASTTTVENNSDEKDNQPVLPEPTQPKILESAAVAEAAAFPLESKIVDKAVTAVTSAKSPPEGVQTRAKPDLIGSGNASLVPAAVPVGSTKTPAMTKYVTNNGIRQYNPAWKEEEAEIALPPFANQATALPVFSSPTNPNYVGTPIVVAASYQQAVQEYEQEIDLTGGTDVLAELSSVLAKYEVPAGMLTKLLTLQHFDRAEVIVDDSGSMQAMTDAKNTAGRPQTRWQEAQSNLMRMMELVSYIPHAPAFEVRFLNRQEVLIFVRSNAEEPRVFLERVQQQVDQTFGIPPKGSTPARQRIEESLQRNPTQSVLRYFMGDGKPNGGPPACRAIEQALLHRPNPAKNPFTFISCTNEDEAVEWMKEAEELAPYCAELDDYEDEAREILHDQGKAFPYSFGLHLVATLVAAHCPSDLDAMDESVPFTKATLEDLMGYQVSEEEYKYYFDSFVTAQRSHKASEYYQRDFAQRTLPSLYPQFVTSRVAADIREVKHYKNRLKRSVRLQQQNGANYQQQQSQQQQYRSTGGGAPTVAQDDCCVIL